MNCDRCSKIPIFEDLSVCILVPTEHHIDPVKNSLLLKNINFKLVNDIFLVEEENLEKIINLFLEMNLSCIEKRDIKLMPLSEKNEVKYENLKKLKSLQYYIDFFSGKDILYVLDKSSIKTFFQPIISANTGEIYGYEALSRGIREDGSIIPPNELFSKARNMDLLFFLDRLCRETVIKNSAKQNISKKVFINFIPTSIYDPQKCLKSTDEALTKYKLDPKNIVFEVVETDYIEDYPHLNNILSYYKDKGYSTALDDIGSGYSDINALLALNPKYMKIDMNLIKNIDTKPKKQEKVVNYIKVAKENNIIALAEGIERKEEADVLIEIFFYLIKVSKCEVFIMNKKYEVLEKLKILFEKENHVNTKLLGDFLKIDRSTASRYLNDLVKEGYLEKILTRPVQYKPALDKSIGFEENIKSNEKSVAVDIKISKLKESSFKSLIGENDSLLQAVQKAKAAILYPPNGLHTLILGETGAGKSYFAEKMHEYAIASKVKPSNAPFVTLNCADYSDNPQLLLAQIFGSKKGSYTGAEKDKEGLLKVSNGGILFLDEVHRLSHQGQEMLFTYMDNGIYRELGSVSNVEGVKVQIIAATTEEHMFCESKRKEY